MSNIETIAQLAQVDKDRVQHVQVNLRHLRQNGALVKVHCMGLSSINRKATNAEQGREDDDPRATKITSGRIRTIPEQYAGALVTLREASRSNLDRMSFDVTGFRPWRYVPVTAFQSWLEKQTEYETSFAEIKADCADALELFVAQERGRTALLAVRTWNAIWANAAKRSTDQLEVIVDGFHYVKSAGDFDVFKQRMIDHAVACIPSATEVQARMSLYWSVGGIETPATYLEELEEEATARTNLRKAQIAEHQAILDAIETGKAASMAQAAQQAEVDAMRAVVAERIRAQLQTLPDPGVEMIEQLRQSTGEIAKNARQSIADKKRLYKGTSAALNGMVDRFDVLNQGDNELEYLIAELRSRMSAGAGNYEYDKLKETLEKIEDVCGQRSDASIRESETLLEVMALPTVGVTVQGMTPQEAIARVASQPKPSEEEANAILNEVLAMVGEDDEDEFEDD